jgi:nucleotide-binding universal stress UspA family protein
MFKHILLAADGSDCSERATRIALELAQSNHAKLTVLYVIDPYPFLGIASINPQSFMTYVEAAQIHAAQVHEKISTQVRQDAPDVVLDCVLLQDVAAATGIVDQAKVLHCDLIVIGSHGRSAMGRLMLGSVAHQILNESSMAVLVAR